MRFHGPDALRLPYHGLYGPERLEPIAAVREGWQAEGCDVTAYFNNDWHGAAVDDAACLARGLGVEPPPDGREL